MISSFSRFGDRAPMTSLTVTEKEEISYFGGLDLGQTNDPTTFAVLKRTRFLICDAVRQGKVAEWRDKKPPIFQVGYLERVPLGTTYPAIVAHVARLMARPIWAGNITLALDKTGVGAPVADLFKSAGIAFAAVTITGGDTETNDGNDWRVPKLVLISRLQALLHEGRLHIHDELSDAQDLVRELQDFRVNFTAAGHMTFGAREGKHDDLVLALAIAAWRANKLIRSSRFIPFSIMER
jgi:hypothetical protein